MRTRRELLAVTGMAVASAGCTGVLGDGSTAGATGDADRTYLEGLSIQNNDDRGHRLVLAVEADDEVQHLGTHVLDSVGGATSVEGDWTSEAGEFRVHARLDDGQVRTTAVSPDATGTTDCVRVLVRIDADGALAVWKGPDCETAPSA